MVIGVLDRASLGMDTPISMLEEFGKIRVYDRSSSTEVLERVSGIDVLIINKIKVTREVIERADSLKLICVFATGYDGIDIDAAREYGIGVCNVPGYSTDSVVLFTVATALSLVSHLTEYNRFVRSGEYTSSGFANRLTPVYHEVRGMTWGIVGCGNIGGAVARVAEAMGARVLAFKRTPDPRYNCTDLETLCRESDIITVHCPLSDSTRGLIGKEQLALMKPTAILVNEARGAVLDEEAVAEAVLSRSIGGFGCDVYSTEPFGTDHPYSKIKDLDNVLLTPHAAWGAYESRVRCLSIICDSIRAYIRGETLNRVDK